MAPAWRWLVLIPIGFLGALTLLRDELLSPVQQQELGVGPLFSLLPNWPWLAWLLVLSVAAIGVLLEGTYRVARALDAKRLAAEQEIARLNARRPLIDLTIEAVGWGGETGHDFLPIMVVLAVRNVGTEPTALTEWRMWIEHHGLRVKLPGQHHSKISIQPDLTQPPRDFFEGDSIYNKTLTPVARGALIRGHFVAHTDDSMLTEGAKISVECEDVFGNVYQVSHVMRRGKDQISYFPGMSL